MRLLCLLFSIIILLQSGLPCKDEAIHPVVTQFSKTHKTSDINKGKKSESDQKDDCSPFCVCNCCSTSYVQQIHSVLAVPFLNYKSDYPSPKPSKFTDVSLPVWQPPKLV